MLPETLLFRAFEPILGLVSPPIEWMYYANLGFHACNLVSLGTSQKPQR